MRTYPAKRQKIRAIKVFEVTVIRIDLAYDTCKIHQRAMMGIEHASFESMLLIWSKHKFYTKRPNLGFGEGFRIVEPQPNLLLRQRYLKGLFIDMLFEVGRTNLMGK